MNPYVFLESVVITMNLFVFIDSPGSAMRSAEGAEIHAQRLLSRPRELPDQQRGE